MAHDIALEDEIARLRGLDLRALQARKVETAQARDLVLKRGVVVSHGLSPRSEPVERC